MFPFLTIMITISGFTNPSIQASFEVWTAQSATMALTGQEATKQRNWDSGIIMAALTSQTSKVTDAVSRARLLAAQSAHAGDWLHAPPITAVGQKNNKKLILKFI